jgi:hypothetical protein
VTSKDKTISCKGGCGRTACVVENAPNTWWCATCVEADVAASALAHGQFTAWSQHRAAKR